MSKPVSNSSLDDQLKRAYELWLILPGYEETRVGVWPAFTSAFRDSRLLVQVFLDDEQSRRQFEEVVRKEPRGRHGTAAQVQLWSPMKTVTDLVKQPRIILDQSIPKKASAFDLTPEGFTAIELDVGAMLSQIQDAISRGPSTVTLTNPLHPAH